MRKTITLASITALVAAVRAVEAVGELNGLCGVYVDWSARDGVQVLAKTLKDVADLVGGEVRFTLFGDATKRWEAELRLAGIRFYALCDAGVLGVFGYTAPPVGTDPPLPVRIPAPAPDQVAS